ncbi:MAG: 2-phospho-L-lactate transferase, partial [Candidatus Bathyarchaeia archaeon]
MIAVLAGGVGGAKFLQGLVRVLGDERLTVVGNVGDHPHLKLQHVPPQPGALSSMWAGLFVEG